MINSERNGVAAEKIEVSNISANGIWLLYGENEFFITYNDFPWFKEASVGKILNIEEPFPGHFYWPDLDIDLSLEIISNPDLFPVKMHQFNIGN